MRTPLIFLVVIAISALAIASPHGDIDCDADPLLCPYDPRYSEQSPPVYVVRLETNLGPVKINVSREWSPYGADRFYQLVTNDYYDGVKFFRVISNFVAQFGIAADATIAQTWEMVTIPNDPMVLSNVRGTVSYAADSAVNDGSFPTCTAPYCAVNRTTQLFFNYKNNSRLDAMDFTPFGVVIDGMDLVDRFYNGYGECADVCDPPNATLCPGPNQTAIYLYGDAYLQQYFPLLSGIVSAEVIFPVPAPYIDIALTVSLIGGVLVVAILIVVIFVVRRRLRELREQRVSTDDDTVRLRA